MPAGRLTPVMRRLVGIISVAGALVIVNAPSSAAPRRAPKTETKTGTVVEVQHKGRRRLLIVEIDGKRQNVAVTPKLNLQITAPGDAGFLRPGQYLSASALMSNDTLFIKELTIRPARKGQRWPPGKIAKAQAKAGESQLAYDVSGLITATQPNPDYPEHTDVALKAAGARAPIMIEPDFTVTVNSSDPAMIPENSEAELEVAVLRGGRFKVVGVTVALTDALTAAEFFGDPQQPVAKPNADKPIAAP